MVLYAITAILFLVIDAVMLTLVMKPLFTRHLGDMMRDSLMLAPAALFYLAYIAGLVFLVSAPALRDAAPERAALQGAVIGAMAYGTYDPRLPSGRQASRPRNSAPHIRARVDPAFSAARLSGRGPIELEQNVMPVGGFTELVSTPSCQSHAGISSRRMGASVRACGDPAASGEQCSVNAAHPGTRRVYQSSKNLFAMT